MFHSREITQTETREDNQLLASCPDTSRSDIYANQIFSRYLKEGSMVALTCFLQSKSWSPLQSEFNLW